MKTFSADSSAIFANNDVCAIQSYCPQYKPADLPLFHWRPVHTLHNMSSILLACCRNRFGATWQVFCHCGKYLICPVWLISHVIPVSTYIFPIDRPRMEHRLPDDDDTASRFIVDGRGALLSALDGRADDAAPSVTTRLAWLCANGGSRGPNPTAFCAIRHAPLANFARPLRGGPASQLEFGSPEKRSLALCLPDKGE